MKASLDVNKAAMAKKIMIMYFSGNNEAIFSSSPIIRGTIAFLSPCPVNVTDFGNKRNIEIKLVLIMLIIIFKKLFCSLSPVFDYNARNS